MGSSEYPKKRWAKIKSFMKETFGNLKEKSLTQRRKNIIHHRDGNNNIYRQLMRYWVAQRSS